MPTFSAGSYMHEGRYRGHPEKHYEPKPLIITERFYFHQRKQATGESITDYVAKLQRLSAHCEFGDYLDQALRDCLVCGLRAESIQKRLLAEADLTLKKALELAQGMEATDHNDKSLKTRHQCLFLDHLRDLEEGFVSSCHGAEVHSAAFEHIYKGSHPCPGTAECGSVLWSATGWPAPSRCRRWWPLPSGVELVESYLFGLAWSLCHWHRGAGESGSSPRQAFRAVQGGAGDELIPQGQSPSPAKCPTSFSTPCTHYCNKTTNGGGWNLWPYISAS